MIFRPILRSLFFLLPTLAVPISAFAKAAPFPTPSASPTPLATPKTPAPPVQAARVLTLEEAFERTLATDQSIRNAYYTLRKANLQPWSALTRLGPRLTGNATYQGNRRKNTYDAVGLEGPTSITTRQNSYSRYVGLTLVQPLFDPTVIPAYHYGKLAAEAARLQYRFTVRETLFGVAQAYYETLKLQSVTRINRETLELAKGQLKQAKIRHEFGEAAQLDVSRAEASLEEARNNLIQSQGMLEVDLDTLSHILNLGGKTDFTLAEPAKAPDPATPVEEALKKAFARREDYRISAIGVEQEKTARQEIAAGYAPRLNAQASTQWTGATGGNSGRTLVNSAVLSVEMPFLTGGQREIDLRSARYEIEQAKLNLETAAKTIEADIRNAWIAVRTGREAIVALRAGVEAATKNYEDTRSFYESGASTSLDVQVALRELNNSRTLLINQLYDYQIALRDLQRAQALFEEERVRGKAAHPRPATTPVPPVSPIP